jgi:uncharacterized SAM-binding protein YcdF (DUF218 family)
MRLRPLPILIAAIVLAAAAVLAFRGAGRQLVVADPLPAHADAIVMLAGSVSDRVLETARLYQEGRAPLVLLTRERLARGAAALRARGIRLPEDHELTKEALVGLGVPEPAIHTLAGRAFSTVSEARTIARYVCKRRLRSIIVVTSPWHTHRARLILAQALGPGVHLTMRPAPAALFPADHWWMNRRAAKDVLTEYEKLTYYWLAQRWRIAPCGGLRRRSAAASVRLDGLAEERGELALGVHLAHDVAAAHELATGEHLRNGRPARVGLHGLSLVPLGEHVDGLVRHADLAQDLDGRGGEAAHREPRRALHVHHDGVLLHLSIDLFQCVAHRAPSPSASVRSCKA